MCVVLRRRRAGSAKSPVFRLTIRVSRMPHLLIIDDQPESVAPLISYLADKSLEVTVACDGADGHAKAIGGRPDLILLNMAMAGSGGLEVCHRLKGDKRTAGIPVLMASTSAAIGDKLKAFSHGAVDYLVKPFSEDEAAARIFVHLQAKQRIDRLESMVAQAALDRVGEQAFPDDVLFSQALSILDKRLTAPPGLVELARELGTNERKLTDIFRQRVGMTVFDYFSEMRLETARHLLQGSRMRIQTIAGHVGYRNAGDFTRAYRRRYGLSPREYRQAG
jgi:DNA-binding response OmpR family regulator